ncbi:MAG: GAF domain-containing sensor histidine kinase [Anaerolineae bacterium]|jgi:signal transduction histidine kinase|nr:GAF domain-containing sensor histidine kinase [Anaerolineae bacterium]MBT7073178.1 GAF domain-containing sensor histidine kinase [Anaerolineae bacterium]MBT7324083.1 GAF domain-containing sensor histidine kinase [Anaerolineae bacterium]
MDEKTKTQDLSDYRRLIEIARDLASTLDLDALLYRIVKLAAEIAKAEEASILLYDDAARQLHFQVATNMELPNMRGVDVPLEGSIAGWILTHREPVRIGDVQDDSRYFDGVENATSFTTQSLLGVPLITKDKVVGVLEVLNKKEGHFTDVDEELLLVLGSQAAVAIENTRLFQQSDLISEFVHELRTPLASLSTATYLLLRPEISSTQHEQIVNNIHSETLRLNALASSFLDLSRLESGRVHFHYEIFDIGKLFNECCEVMQTKADEENIQVKIDIPDALPEFEADPSKIKQVVLNLLSNAIKYNRPHGTVTLKARMEKEQMRLDVKDTGYGIPEDAMPHLFKKFFRVHETESKVAGTGLGLSISKQIVQGHKGTIEVKSKSGKGTTFIIRLPLRAVRD